MFTKEFERIYYTRQEIRAYFFRGYKLEGTELVSDICCNLDPPYEIICVTVQDYFDRKQCDSLLGFVFVMNTNYGYIDYPSMNVEVTAFKGTGAVNAVETDIAE